MPPDEKCTVLSESEEAGRLIFDTHTHYMSKAFDGVREALLASLPAKGVALALECGTDLDSCMRGIELARRYGWIYAAVGIHPESLIEKEASTLRRFYGNWREELKAIELLLMDPKVKAVGEAGLDHHWPVPRDAQLCMFEAQIKMALEYNLPLCIHDREAHAETYALLKKYRPKGVLHAYSGSAEDSAWLCRQGIYIGLGGAVTFKNARRSVEVAAALPGEYLLLETDCPYMAPVPMRGRRCDSSMLHFTARQIANARGVTPEALQGMTLENGKRLFGIA